MFNAKVPKTVLEAIIMTIENNPKKQATLDELLYVVVSESGTVRPSELKDTSKSIALLPGGSIIIPSYF